MKGSGNGDSNSSNSEATLIIFKNQTTLVKEDSGDAKRKLGKENLMPKQNVEQQKLEVAGFKQTNKEAKALLTATNKITQEVLTAFANVGKRNIESAI